MTDTTITALPAAAPLTGTEIVPVDQGAQTVGATAQAIAALADLTPVAHPRCIDGSIAGNNPTKAECNAALTALNLDRSKDWSFFIRDITGAPATLKQHFVLYRANGDTNVGGTNYRFWTVALTEAT
jgi:hypothetical protein